MTQESGTSLHARPSGATAGRGRRRWLACGPAIFAIFAIAALIAGCRGGGEAGGSEGSPTATVTADATDDGGTATADEEKRPNVVDKGDTVSLHYRGTLDDGTEFDSSAGRAPLTFEAGAGAVISGFDEAVVGMAEGEKKTFRLEPAEAYGEVDPARVVTVPAENAPDGLEVGQQVTLGNTPATVTEINADGSVVVDANHPLAGQALTFEIEIVSVEDAP